MVDAITSQLAEAIIRLTSDVGNLLGLLEKDDENGGNDGDNGGEAPSCVAKAAFLFLKVILLFLDFVSTALDWQVSFRLLNGDYTTFFGEYHEAADINTNHVYGAYIGIMLLSHLFFLRGKWFYIHNNNFFTAAATELSLYSIEDSATVFLFVYASGLFNANNIFDRMNLIVINVSGYIDALLLWGFFFYGCLKRNDERWKSRLHACLLPLWVTLEIVLVSLMSFRTLIQKKWIDIFTAVGYISGDEKNYYDFWIPIATAIVTLISVLWILCAQFCWGTCLGLHHERRLNCHLSGSIKELVQFLLVWTVFFSATVGLGFLLYTLGDSSTEFQWVQSRNEVTGAVNATSFGHLVDWGHTGLDSGYRSSLYVASDSYCATIEEDDRVRWVVSGTNATFPYCSYFETYAGFETNESGTFGKLQISDCIIDGPILHENATIAGRKISIATGRESSETTGYRDHPSHIVVGYPYAGRGHGLVRVYRVQARSGAIREECNYLNLTQIGPDISPRARRRWGDIVSMAKFNDTIFVTTSRRRNTRSIVVSTFELNGTGHFVNVGYPLRSNVSNNGFGHSLELSDDGHVLIVGAPRAHETGNAFAYQRQGSEWIPMGKPLASSVEGNHTFVHFGYAVAISGDGRRIAAACETSSHSLVYVFEFDGSTNEWQLLGSPVEYGNKGFHAGYSDSLSMDNGGRFIAIGSVGSQNSSGYVRIYKFAKTIT